MSTTTPRLSLLKAAPTDVVDIVADVDDAFDKIDAAVGFQPLTSFPGSPFSGKSIQRTDFGDKPYLLLVALLIFPLTQSSLVRPLTRLLTTALCWLTIQSYLRLT
jgi:hypothetical protein